MKVERAWLWMVTPEKFAVYVEGAKEALTFTDPVLACVYAQTAAKEVICQDSAPDFLFPLENE